MKFSLFLQEFTNALLDETIDPYFVPAKHVPLDFFGQYVRDVEHGFFHGLVACYMYWLIEKKPRSQTIASILLHDFLKCNNYSQELHDKMLLGYYANLLDETYTHSNPPKEHEQLHVIVCDRMELRRYSDYATWVDGKFHAVFQNFDKEIVSVIDDFYENVRPLALREYQSALLESSGVFQVLIQLILKKLTGGNMCT